MQIKGYSTIKRLIEDQLGRRFVASLDRSRYDIPESTRETLCRTLESILYENIVPFWFPRCIDEDAGGYHCECSLSGKWDPRRHKDLFSQTRILWFVSRLINFGRTSEEHLRWAHHGFRFLRDFLLDKEYGGFYWQVDIRNGEPIKPDKHLCGQAYALYAVSEFALATRDVEALQMAEDLFQVIDRQAHDARYGGYHEFFTRDWGQADPNERSYMGQLPNVKQLNTHVHLLEAFTRYANLVDGEHVRTRLTEVLQIESSAVVRKDGGGCTDTFSTEWRRYTGRKFDRVSYGHDLENLWLLIEANRALGVSNTPFVELYEHLFLNAVRYGWDRTRSGFYFKGRLFKPASRRDKFWWTQAEGMLAALHLYALTRQGMYYQVFERTLAWIDRYQIDWTDGEWYAKIDESNRPSGNKAADIEGGWKTPYHNGRAVIHCLELLDSIR